MCSICEMHLCCAFALSLLFQVTVVVMLRHLRRYSKTNRQVLYESFYIGNFRKSNPQLMVSVLVTLVNAIPTFYKGTQIPNFRKGFLLFK